MERIHRKSEGYALLYCAKCKHIVSQELMKHGETEVYRCIKNKRHINNVSTKDILESIDKWKPPEIEMPTYEECMRLRGKKDDSNFINGGTNGTEDSQAEV